MTHTDGTAHYGRTWNDSDGRGDSGLPHVRVVQWNVLADTLSKGSDDEYVAYDAEGMGVLPGQRWVGWGAAGPPQDYQRPHLFRCAQRWLAWEYRGPRIAAELRRFNADIVALQEVDHFDYLKAELAGYDGVFAKKPGYEDGVALLWKGPWRRGASKVFRFSRGAQVAIAQRLLLPSEAKGADGRARVKALVAVSMHLKAGFSDKFEVTRETQLSLLAEAVRQFAQGDPVVLLADLNAHPSDLEGMPAQAVPMILGKGYASAYADGGFTVWSGWSDGEVRAAFDHILFTATDLRCRRNYGLPSVAAVGSEPCRLPNHRWPSDHLPLAADLLLRRAARELHPDTDDVNESTVTLTTPQMNAHQQGLAILPGASGVHVCKYYVQGLCAYSQACKLPHSDGRRGERCYFFDTGQQCRHGDGCHFMHSTVGARVPQRVAY